MPALHIDDKRIDQMIRQRGSVLQKINILK